MVALEHKGWESTPLTTLERVKELTDPRQSTTERDSMLVRHIEMVSQQVTDYLGWHTLRRARTETHAVRNPCQTLTLDSRPVATAADKLKLRYATRLSELAEAEEEDADDYTLQPGVGYLRLNLPYGACSRGGFVRVSYTGGLIDPVTVPAVEIREENAPIIDGLYTSIGSAVEMQVKYLGERIKSIGGDIQALQGGTTKFNSQYGLLSVVRELLDRHRRHHA